MDFIRCNHCSYEVSEVNQDTGFCQTCQKLYDLGYADGHYDGRWDN